MSIPLIDVAELETLPEGVYRLDPAAEQRTEYNMYENRMVTGEYVRLARTFVDFPSAECIRGVPLNRLRPDGMRILVSWVNLLDLPAIEANSQMPPKNHAMRSHVAEAAD